MKAFNAVLFFALLFFLVSAGTAQQCDLITDSDAYITKDFFSESESFIFISNGDLHPVRVFWFNFLWIKICRVWRSYMHFPADMLPPCVDRAFLRLNFGFPRPLGVMVEVKAVEWDGLSDFTWDTQPSSYWSTQLSVPSSGVIEVDVTEPVQEVINGDRTDLAFMVKLSNEMCGSTRRGFRNASFDSPCLRFEPCTLEVKVDGLKDFEVTQSHIASSRYAPLGELTVSVHATTPYEVRACYEVDPPPPPTNPFTADPVDIAYTWVWLNMPACPSYIVLPGFSGTPGNETHTYRVRVDLADLGDRASGETFTFGIRVWAVPQ